MRKAQFTFICVILSVIALNAQVNQRGGTVTITTQKKTKGKLALVIGNSAYGEQGRLANPVNDADSMAKALVQLNFDTMLIKDADLRTMKNRINEFGERLKEYESGLFYYAGHGAEAKGINYLFPIGEAPPAENEMEFYCYNIDQVLAKMDAAETSTNIIILDACRNNPFTRGWKRSLGETGLAKMEAPKGTFIGFAASPGSTASDGDGKNGSYTRAILNNIRKENMSLLDMFTVINRDVRKSTNDTQVPFLSSSLNEIFYFKENKNITANAEQVLQTDKRRIIAQRIKDMFYEELLDKSFNEINNFVSGPGVYGDPTLPQADECGAENKIYYFFKYFDAAPDKRIAKKLSDNIIGPFFSDNIISRENSYFIFFFQNKKSYKVEYRLALKDNSELDMAFRRTLDWMDLKDQFYFEMGPYYYSMWKDSKMQGGSIKIAMGLKEKKKVCLYDWWYYKE